MAVSKTAITQIALGDDVLPDVANQPHLDLETNIDDIINEINSGNVGGVGFNYDAATSSGLNFGYTGGIFENRTAITVIAASTILLTDNDVNYVEIDTSTATISTNVVGFGISNIPLWIVTTSGGAIAVTTDNRAPFALRNTHGIADNATATAITIDASGNVGIGQSTPTSLLHLKNANPDIKIESSVNGGIGTISFYDETDTLRYNIGYRDTDTNFYIGKGALGTSTNRLLTINTDGNVGIGVSDLKPWHSSVTAIDMAGRTSLFRVNNGSYLSNNVYYDGTWKRQEAATAVMYNLATDGKHTFYIGATGAADSTITWVTGMLLDEAGTLGVGNSNLDTWSGGHAVQIGTRSSVFGWAGVGSYFLSNTYYNGGWKYQDSTYATSYDQNAAGEHVFKVAPSGTADSSLAWTTTLKIINSGTITAHTRFVADSDFFIKERASAVADVAGYGQLWVKNTTPCQLWFTDDSGVDYQLNGGNWSVSGSNIYYDSGSVSSVGIGGVATNTAFGLNIFGGTTTGTLNSAFGQNALNVLTTGTGNTGIGYGAGSGITTGGYNTCIGTSTASQTASAGLLYGVTIGYQAGRYASGNFSVFIGYNSGGVSTGLTGHNNVGLGQASLSLVTTGGGNVALGSAAGDNITTGTTNVCVGYQSQPSTANASHQIVIGNVAGSADNRVTIGNTTNAIEADFNVSATWTYTSDIRKKNVIGDSTLGLDFINNLNTVKYTYKPVEEWPTEWGYKPDPDNEDFTKKVVHGLIAQDVKAALEKAGVDDFQGWLVEDTGLQKLGATDFIYPLIRAVQELSAQVEELKNKG